MPQEKKIQDLVKFHLFISLPLIGYHRVNNQKYTFHPSREVLHLSTCPHIGRVKVLNESGK